MQQWPLRRDRSAALGVVGAFVLWIAGSPAQAATPFVEGMSLTGSPAAARLTLDLSSPARATVFTLDHPDRLVIDLRARRAAHRLVMPPAQGLVRAVRTAPRDGGLRIVLDLGGPIVTPPASVSGRLIAIEVVPRAAAAESAAPVPAAASPTTAAAAGRAKAVERSLPTTTRDLVIAVDAGHGGDDPGATGRDGTREKDVTLAVARVLAQRINSEPGMRAVLTRSGDVFVPLRERIRRARNAQADLFVSVHADAVADRNVAGSSVYVLSQRGASSEAAKWLADRENSADLIGGVSLDDKDNVLASVLLDLSQSAAMSASMAAAEKVLGELNQVGEVRKTRVQQAGFVVLKSPDIPSMLIESAYITNPAEERQLRDPRHQSELADAILSGLRAYFLENPPPGTKLAALASATVAANSAPPAHALSR